MMPVLSWSTHYKREQVFVYAADGVKLAGTYYDCGTEHTAILVHGYNAIPQTALCFQATDLFEQGFNVLMINQRGHGASGGRFTGLGLLECDDLFEWMKLAREKQPKARFLLYGSSMGCASVAYAADRYDPDSVMGMVLDCGFSSIYGQLSDDALRRRLPAPLILPYLRLLAGKLLHIEIKENVKTHLAMTKVPALFIHGGSDKTVDANNGYSNFHACASAKTAVFPDECGHCACYVKYRDEIMRRIRQICETER